jgi:hypothetical protein
MAVRRAVLLIADIGGYTNFLQWNRMDLAHAQLTVAGLLEAVIDAGRGLKLAKLEGDAAFFWAPDGDAGFIVGQRLPHIRRSFLMKRDMLALDRACDCASCSQLEGLSLKFVAHEGEVAEQRVKRHAELIGIDVVLVHRMLKNSVPLNEYVLMTDPVVERLEEPWRGRCMPLTHTFEGIGETSTHYIDLARVHGPDQPPRRSLLRRLAATARLEAGSLPYRLGGREPARGFRNLGRGGQP